MSHSIIRVQKMKSPVIKSYQIHNQREKESKSNPDIQKDKTHLNYDLINGKNKIDYKKEIEKKISENVKSDKTIRKDAVRLSEFLITSDKPFFANISPDEQKRYFEVAKDFIADTYGEQNLIYATVHLDEKTPHMHVGLVPVTEDGRLSAKDVFGRRMEFVKLQDNFNAHVKAHGFDLERGVSSSRKHLDVAKFKAKTAYEAEKEATKNYEQTLSKIKMIDEKVKAVEDIPDPNRALGRVIMKNEDYDMLVNFALTGAIAEADVVDLQQKLADKEQEIVQQREQHKEEITDGQEQIRKNYTKIESESRKTQEKLEELAEEKAKEKFEQIFNEQKIVKKYDELSNKYQEKINDYNELKTKHHADEKKIQQLEFAQKSSHREEAILNATISEKETEVASLKKENGSLHEQIKTMQQEFEAWKEMWKERISHVLNRQFTQIKTLLRVNNIEPHHIKFLEENQEKIVANILKEMEKPKEKAQTQEMEM